MIEIGQTLGDARRHRGLGLGDVERATRISTRSLRALEEERFEALGAPFYARTCLREYAEFLGLDSDLLVEEYRVRFPEVEEPLSFQPIAQPRPTWRSRRVAGTLVVAAAVTAMAVLAFRPTGEPPRQAAPAEPPARPATTVEHAAPRKQEPASTVPRIALVAARGDCWLSVRAGSRDGRLLFEGTVRRGEVVRFRKQRLWVRLGAPWNVEVRVDGRVLAADPAVGSRPRNVLISRRAIRDA